MTATEELRRMLDERGVEWGIADYSKHKRMTVWRVDGMEWNYFEDDKTGWTVLSSRSGYLTTPAQAIAATLGRGTCHMRLVYEEEDADGFIWPNHYECDACGANVNGIMPSYDTEIQPHFCPNCGREVVTE